jgi:hypothetical protein
MNDMSDGWSYFSRYWTATISLSLQGRHGYTFGLPMATYSSRPCGSVHLPHYCTTHRTCCRMTIAPPAPPDEGITAKSRLSPPLRYPSGYNMFYFTFYDTHSQARIGILTEDTEANEKGNWWVSATLFQPNYYPAYMLYYLPYIPYR